MKNAWNIQHVNYNTTAFDYLKNGYALDIQDRSRFMIKYILGNFDQNNFKNNLKENEMENNKIHLVNVGNVDDIKTNLRILLKKKDVIDHPKAAIKYLKSEIELEKSERNRSTVIKMLEVAIRRLSK